MSRLGGALNPFNAGNPLNPFVNRALGLPTATGPAAPRFGSRGYEFNREKDKHEQMAASAEVRAQELRQQGDIAGANRLEMEARNNLQRSQAYAEIANDPTQRDLRGDNYIAAQRRVYSNETEVKPLLGKKPSEVQFPEGYRRLEVDPRTGKPVEQPGTGVSVYGVVDPKTGQLNRSMAILREVDGKLTANDYNYTSTAPDAPNTRLGNGVEVPTLDVIRAMDDVAGRFIDIQPRGSRKPTGTSPISIDITNGFSTPLRALEDGRTTHVGKDQNGDPHGYGQKPAMWGNWAITSLFNNAGHGYHQLRSLLGDVDMSQALSGLRQGKPPANLSGPQRGALGELFGLWQAKEPSHPRGSNQHRRDLIYSEMIMDMMTTPGKNGKPLSLEDAIDLHPASFGGAQTGAQLVTGEMNRPNQKPAKDGSERRVLRDERMLREQATLEAWFERFGSDLSQSGGQPSRQDIVDFMLQRRFQSSDPVDDDHS
jgi:hypothetical protein